MNLRKLKYIKPNTNIDTIKETILKYNNNPIIEFKYKICVIRTNYILSTKDYEYSNVIIRKENNNLYTIVKSRFKVYDQTIKYSLNHISNIIDKIQQSYYGDS